MKNSTATTTRNLRRTIVVSIAAVSSIGAVGVIANAQSTGPSDPPPWSQCGYRHLPVAADLGGILPVNYVPPAETQAALRGEIAIGTDCSIYDSPV